MNIRKDVQIAWNLLGIVQFLPKKTLYYQDILNREFGMNVTMSVLSKIVAELVAHKLLNARRGLGICKSRRKVVYLSDVMKALNAEFIESPGPMFFVSQKIKTILDTAYILNNKYGDDDDSKI